ncbi:hypothetical protein EJ06DRAFT_179182 [Trichodelitschia bisporula]|uniref:Uncharacterized protein n=1 Tax=Trichodelitschia bisporula TaxID=703511 RepID=A0A6G1HM04_9PEZI|nr:hypothetical protein EJ06DRAFT_179182 [Trichodelitschia bisporula]
MLLAPKARGHSSRIASFIDSYSSQRQDYSRRQRCESLNHHICLVCCSTFNCAYTSTHSRDAPRYTTAYFASQVCSLSAAVTLLPASSEQSSSRLQPQKSTVGLRKAYRVAHPKPIDNIPRGCILSPTAGFRTRGRRIRQPPSAFLSSVGLPRRLRRMQLAVPSALCLGNPTIHAASCPSLVQNRRQLPGPRCINRAALGQSMFVSKEGPR